MSIMAAVVETFLDITPIDYSKTCLKEGSLKDEVAVVTGSTTNIGLGYARAIAWAGGKVVVTGTNEKAGAEAQRVINAENAPDTALFVKCDLKSDNDIENLATKTFEKFGRVDILINNAMNLALNGPVLGTPVRDLDEGYAISGHSVMLLMQKFVPGMVERKHGAVVYSATQFHYKPPMFGGAMYTASKSVATSLTMSLANEVGSYKESGIGVFCVIPAGVLPPNTPRYVVSPDGRDMSQPLSGASAGFNGPIPPEAAGAAITYCLLNAEKLHGSGIFLNDALHAMEFPFPNPATASKRNMRRLTDTELTLVFGCMGPGFDEVAQ